MLSDKERQEIEAELPHYPRKQALCIEALKVVQRHRGWVDNEALRDIAGFLDMTEHEVDSVATFYNLIYRREVGRNVIHLCDSISCWVMGCDGIRAHMEKTLGIEMGQTTADGKFTLLPIPCLGDCDRAPSVMIGRKLHSNLTPESIDDILRQCD
ncbi:MAG: NADH-quinone oxidoreductase subunit NuoE [Dehalococcoidia bacterium]